MTYNIRLDTDADGDNRWANRRAMVAGQMRLFSPDIFGMQEVQPNQKAEVAQDLPDYIILGGGRDNGIDQGEASPLGVKRSHWKVESHGQFWLSPTPDKGGKAWDADYPRVATWAHLRSVKGRTHILAINTHFDHVGKIARLESAKQIANWATANRKAGEYVVLMGDFNTTADSAPFAALTATGGKMVFNNSRDLSATPPAGPPGTFNAFDYNRRDPAAIDHILVGPNIAVTQHVVVEQTVSGRLPSDHYPVIADLALGTCKPKK